MRTLIVEDDFTSRMLIQELLRPYGPSHVAVDGQEAVDAVRAALEAGEPYDLICLDIMMPEVTGQEALTAIRALEAQRGKTAAQGSRILMTTALSDSENIMRAFREQCDGYLIKPIDKARLLGSLEKLGLGSADLG